MNLLNTVDAGIWDGASGEFLDPLVTDPGALGDLGKAESGRLHQAYGSVEKGLGRFGHGLSMSKTLPIRQILGAGYSETPYLTSRVVFYSMEKSPASRARAALKRNAALLKGDESGKVIEKRTKGSVAAKTINNIINERHATNLDNVAEVAEAFQVPVWMLLLDELPDQPRARKSLEQIVRAYVMVDDDARERIARRALAEAEDAPLPKNSNTSGNSRQRLLVRRNIAPPPDDDDAPRERAVKANQ